MELFRDVQCPQIAFRDENDNNFPSVPCFLDDVENTQKRVHCYSRGAFSLILINIRSIRRNFAVLSSVLSVLEFSFDIIILTETWLTRDTDYMFSIPGYNCLSVYRNQYGGGIRAYIKDRFKAQISGDLSYVRDSVEILSFTVEDKPKNYFFTCVYRPPKSSIVEFNEIVMDEILPLVPTNCNSVVCGDFNVNMFNPLNLVSVNQFVNIMAGFGYFPVIDKPTRVCESNPVNKFSLLDHIWCNFYSGVDHL